MARRRKNDPRPPPGSNVGIRNRASPARLVKIYSGLTPDQRKMVQDVQFGGLLQIACHTIPADFANWLLTECFQAETMELVLPGRGRISVTDEAVSDILGVPNRGEEVVYDLVAEAINFINEKYNLDQGTAPRIEQIVDRVKENKNADEDFLRSFMMLAVSTFLCLTTSLHISPRCYPSIVDLDKVKNLNWANFIVKQLKEVGSKLNTKGSVKGCVLVLVILYADALEAPSLRIPNTRPRVAAWVRKLLDTLIRLDINRDGTYGKLKLKQSAHTSVQESLFKMDDLFRFVSSKARGMEDEEKKKLSDAVGKMMCGITDIVGNFVQEIGAIRAKSQHAAGPSFSPGLRRSKRRRTTPHEEPQDEELQDEEDTDYAEPEDVICSDDEETEPENDEDYEDGAGLGDGEHGEDEEVGEGEDKDEEPPAKKESPKRCRMDNQDNQDAGSCREELHPISEGHEEDFHTGHVDGHRSASNTQGDANDVADNTPLSVRLLQIKNFMEPKPLEVIYPHKAKDRRARLRLPERGTTTHQPKDPPMSSKTASTSNHKRSKTAENLFERQEDPLPIARSNSLDFTPPETNIKKFVDEDEESPAAGSDFWLGLDEDSLTEIEENAIKEFAMKKSQASQHAAATAQQPSVPKFFEVASTSKSVEVIEGVKPTPPATEIGVQRATPSATGIEPSSVNSSVAPAFHPAPRRKLRRGAVLKSPYIDIAPKRSFQCSKEFCYVYEKILETHLHPPKSRDITSKEIIIINFNQLYIYLNELAESVKPGGELMNTVAEVAIHAINPKGRGAFKRIMPVRLSGYLLSGDFERADIKRSFKKGTNNLDHRQMVMFPVLQTIKIKELDRSICHYFLLVLNIRNARFEVLDSMRTLADNNLRTCCYKLMDSIKQLWSEYYSESEIVIDKYQLEHIPVTVQDNNHDCGFHMLMHAEHWDGRAVCNFSVKDMPNIRKLLTHKWFMHPENDTLWKHKFTLPRDGPSEVGQGGD